MSLCLSPAVHIQANLEDDLVKEALKTVRISPPPMFVPSPAGGQDSTGILAALCATCCCPYKEQLLLHTQGNLEMALNPKLCPLSGLHDTR